LVLRSLRIVVRYADDLAVGFQHRTDAERFLKEFRERLEQTEHEDIVDIVSIKFVRPDVAIVETLQMITGYQKLLPGTSADAKGRLRIRLLQVLVKDSGEWKIAAYHNVDVKLSITVPEPK
jgi:hypothetical protein